jgi:hypothetical protein
VTVTVTRVKVATCTVVVDITIVDVVAVTVEVDVFVGMLRQLQAFDTLVQANCLKPGGALAHASGATGVAELGFAVLAGAATVELDLPVEVTLTGFPRLAGGLLVQEPGTVTLDSVSGCEIDRTLGFLHCVNGRSHSIRGQCSCSSDGSLSIRLDRGGCDSREDLCCRHGGRSARGSRRNGGGGDPKQGGTE